MTRFVGLAVSAGLMLAATAANAQMQAPFRAISDFDGPYGAPYGYGAPPPVPPPVYNYGNYRRPLLPPTEVYAVLRDNGFSPLGIPHQRGLVYTIAVLDRNGDDGRLVIDARDGRIIRFMPAWGSNWGPPPGPYGESFNAAPMPGYGGRAALPPPTVIRGLPPRPPAPVPHVASRAVPLPAPKPSRAVEPPQRAQQSAAIETRPVTPPPAVAPPTTVGEARPAPVIRPTRPMPPAEGFE